MAYIILPSRWTRQPKEAVELNPAFPRPISLWLPSVYGLKDLIGGRTIASLAVRPNGMHGGSIGIDSNGQTQSYNASFDWVGSDATILFVGRTNLNGASNAIVSSYGGAGFSLGLGNDTSNYLHLGTGTGYQNGNITLSPFVVGQDLQYVGSMGNAIGSYAALNGKEYWSGTKAPVERGALVLFSQYFGTGSFCSLLVGWGRQIDRALAKELSNNPWQLFKPIQRRIYVPSAATGGAQNLTATLLTNTSTFGTHVLAPGAVALTATTLTNTSTFGTHSLAATFAATATTLTNTSTFGTHVLAPGAAPLTATTLTNTSVFGTHVLSATFAATATTLTNTSTFGTHVLTPGAVTLNATLLTNVSTFGTHVLEGGAGGTQSLTATVLTNASTFGTHVLAPGAAPLTATTLTNTSTFGTHVLSATYTVAASLLTNASTFGTHVLEQGAAQLVATTLTNASTFGTHVLTGGESAAEEAATGGWLRARRQRRLDEISRLPTPEEVREQRERLGILPKKAQKAVEKVAERELSSAAADDDSLESAIREFFSGALQERAERALRNELSAKGQRYQPEAPGVLRAILADGLRKAAEAEISQQRMAAAAMQEEAEVQELLALFIEM